MVRLKVDDRPNHRIAQLVFVMESEVFASVKHRGISSQDVTDDASDVLLAADLDELA